MKTLLVTYYLLFTLLLSGVGIDVFAQNNFENAEVTNAELIDVSIKSKDSKVILNWDVHTNKEVKSYLIERSFDGKSYVPIYQTHYLQGGSNYSDFLMFSNNQSEFIYYKLTVEYEDGSTDQTKFQPLNLLEGKNLKPTIISASNSIEVSFLAQKRGSVTMQIFNTTGNLVVDDVVYVQKGENFQTIDSYRLRSGMYFLRLQQNDKTTTTKFYIR